MRTCYTTKSKTNTDGLSLAWFRRQPLDGGPSSGWRRNLARIISSLLWLSLLLQAWQEAAGVSKWKKLLFK